MFVVTLLAVTLPPVTLLPSLPMLVPVRPLPYNPAWNLIVCCFADEYEGSDSDSSDSDLLLRAPCNVVTSGCGELWTSAPSPHMPEYQGHYVTQQFLDDEDGETMIGEFDKDDLEFQEMSALFADEDEVRDGNDLCHGKYLQAMCDWFCCTFPDLVDLLWDGLGDNPDLTNRN